MPILHVLLNFLSIPTAEAYFTYTMCTHCSRVLQKIRGLFGEIAVAAIKLKLKNTLND